MATVRPTPESLPARGRAPAGLPEGEAAPSLGASAPWAQVSRRLNAWARALFVSLEVIAIALGVMIYAGDPFGFVHRRLAFWSLLLMAGLACIARGVAWRVRHVHWLCSVEVLILLAYATLLTQSMGASDSPFIALYAITLLAAALVWKPVWVVAMAILICGFTLMQMGFLDLMDEMPLFAILIVVLNALLPAAIAGVIVAVVRQLV
ncbi:MAG TPA: hypothetical protein VMF64_06190 [Steroidobacteraceae bacterium]|nr:hypothetical protein [Steroidobacteraceae bacterium]